MNTPIIMVQIADRQWTLEALRAACAIARKPSTIILLVKMVPVQHLGWLGSDWGNLNFSAHERTDFEHYQAIIAEYGHECIPVLFQYTTWIEGMIQTVAYVNADIVFAPKPRIILPLWRRFRIWDMKRCLAHHGCAWIHTPIYAADAVTITTEHVQLGLSA